MPAAPSHDPASAEGRWVGYVDRVEQGAVEGWCCDLSDMDRSLCVEARAADGRRAVVIADIHRRDVQEAGFGNGRHGFRLALHQLGDADDMIVIRISESGAVIGRVPVSLDACSAALGHAFPETFLALMRHLAEDLRIKHAEMERTMVNRPPARLPPQKDIRGRKAHLRTGSSA